MAGNANSQFPNAFDVLANLVDKDVVSNLHVSAFSSKNVVDQVEDIGLNLEDNQTGNQRLQTVSLEEVTIPITSSVEIVDQEKNVVESMEATIRNGCLTPVRWEGKKNVRFDHVEIYEYESYEQYD